METAVHQFERQKYRVHIHLRAKYLRGCMQEAYLDRDMTPPILSHCEKLVMLVQNIWGHITLPTDLSWNILVLIPKVNVYTRGIGMPKFLWKFI